MGACQTREQDEQGQLLSGGLEISTQKNLKVVHAAGGEDDSTPTLVEDRPMESPFASPVIGILSQPDSSNSGKTLIASSYVRLIESAGGRVVPIKFDMPKADLANLMDTLCGIVLCGGHTHLNDKDKTKPDELSILSPYGETIKFIVERAMRMTDAGNSFPLWGICLGMQSILVVTDLRNKTLQSLNTDGEYLSSVGTFQRGATESRLYSGLPYTLNSMTQQTDLQLCYYNHKFGIKERIFTESEIISKNFRLLSVNKDKSGTDFVTSYEGIVYPFRGTQFHPEKIQFEWKVKANRRPEAAQFSQFLAGKFLEDCKKNRNQMNEKSFQATCIHNFATASHGKYSQVYII